MESQSRQGQRLQPESGEEEELVLLLALMMWHVVSKAVAGWRLRLYLLRHCNARTMVGSI